MSTLPTFLLARYADDEALARAATERNGATWTASDLDHSGWRIAGTTEFGNPRSYRGDGELWDDEGAMGMWPETAAHVAAHNPARVLADVAAKRAIVELHGANEYRVDPCDAHDGLGRTIPCPTLRHLAAPYASHPDFNPAWVVT